MPCYGDYLPPHLRDFVMRRTQRPTKVKSTSVCRICMSRGPSRLVFNRTDPGVADDVYKYYGVKITQNDTKSKLICLMCMKCIERYRGMKKKVKNSQLELHSSIKEVFRDDVEEIDNKLRIKEVIEPLIKSEPEIDVPKIDIPKIDIKPPKVEFIPKEEFPEEIVIKKERGCLVCKYCGTFSDSVEMFVNHLSEQHKIYKELRTNEVYCCPMCGDYYEFKNDLDHLQKCFSLLKISYDEFLCNLCNVIFKNVSDVQFYKHYMFCKSFKKIYNYGKQYYKCSNCTFESNDMESSSEHANESCLHYKMNLMYTKRPNKQLNGKLNLKQFKRHLPVPIIKHEFKSISISGMPRYDELLHFSNNYCIGCKNKILSNENLFYKHFMNNEIKSGIEKLWFSKFCCSDMEYSDDFLFNQLSEMSSSYQLNESNYDDKLHCSVKREPLSKIFFL